MSRRRRILVVTGTRAEFGLLRPVIDALRSRPGIETLVAVTGTHLIGAEPTEGEVAAHGPIAARYPMQREGETGRAADAAAFARGAAGAAETIARLDPDGVIVLGDRIEAFAAASAAAIAGVRVVHLHGGDRAEGIADESMRHAISKLAHLHAVATESSAERLRRMGEDAHRIEVVGSPAIDGLAAIAPLDDARYAELGRPEIVVLLHPTGRDAAVEERDAALLLAACAARGRILALEPNHDPGREGIVAAIKASGVRSIAHLERSRWIALLRRVRLLAGNSSAGLIEAAALRLRVLDIGSRQRGRERGGNVLHAETPTADAVGAAWAMADPPESHPYGDGRAGERTAALIDSGRFEAAAVAKRNAY